MPGAVPPRGNPSWTETEEYPDLSIRKTAFYFLTSQKGNEESQRKERSLQKLFYTYGITPIFVYSDSEIGMYLSKL
jgi:hypothetical protein